MKCSNCGKSIKRGAQFCTNCGAPVAKTAPAAEPEATPATPPAAAPAAEPSAPAAVLQPKRRSKKKIVLLIVCIVLALAVIVAGVFFALHLLNPVNRVMSALESGDYTKAATLYTGKVEDDRDKRNTLNTQVQMYLAECDQASMSEQLSYEQYISIINGIRSLDLRDMDDMLDTVTQNAEERNQAHAAYQTAESFYASQDYASAISYYGQVLGDAVHYEDAQNKYAECVTAYRQQVLDSADEQVSHGDYPGALATLDEALKLLSDDADLTAKRNTLAAKQRELGIEQAYAEANAMYELNDLRGAIRYLKNALTQYDDESLQQLLNTCVDKLTEQMKTEAEQAFQNGEWSDAVEVIQSYSSALGDTQAYSDQLDYYSNLRAVPLSQLDTFSGEWSVTGPLDDLLGNAYQDGLAMYVHYTETVEYHLNGEYTSLAGTLTNKGGYLDVRERRGYFKFYADDTLVYTSPVIDDKTEPIPFELSLSGVKFLKIEIINDLAYGTNIDALMIADAQLNKY